MKLLTNENFPRASYLIIKKGGYDVIAIGIGFNGISDEEVVFKAIQENRTILTFDRDYGELIFKHNHKPKAGVIYFRIKNFTPDEPALIFLELIKSEKYIFEGYFTVIDRQTIRQRII
jgi:predicted nuclease of predicted toxin-antitoxin system